MHFLENIDRIFRFPFDTPVEIFACVLFLVLVAKMICRVIRIPSIIGLIVAGIIVGPHGFNILSQNLAVTLFATTGLLYIMFNAGIELDLERFKSYRHQSIIFGLLTFSIPFAIGFPVFHYIFEYSFLASALIAIMFSTHTLIAYPLISKNQLTAKKSVAIAVGGTIITDTLVLLILALLTGSHGKGVSVSYIMQLLVGFSVFSLIIFLILPVAAKWFFARFRDTKTYHYLFVLLMVFVSAILAEIAGVDAIIGAFFCGLALNRFISKKPELKKEIEFIGNSLFIPVFLISVGMIVNLNVVLKGELVIYTSIALIVIALFSKWLAALVAQKAFHYNSTDRRFIFGLSSAHAAATLAIILIGYQQQILNDVILNSTILLILVSCLCATFVTESALRRLEGEKTAKHKAEVPA